MVSGNHATEVHGHTIRTSAFLCASLCIIAGIRGLEGHFCRGGNRSHIARNREIIRGILQNELAPTDAGGYRDRALRQESLILMVPHNK